MAFIFHSIWDVIPTPLTNSIIFQRGDEKPPVIYYIPNVIISQKHIPSNSPSIKEKLYPLNIPNGHQLRSPTSFSTDPLIQRQRLDWSWKRKWWACAAAARRVEYQESVDIGSMVLLYMVTWIPSIYPLYVSIYTSTMDPMGVDIVRIS